jgi:lactoylglutathione lyase
MERKPVFREPFPIIYVADVTRASQCYVEHFGFEQTFDWTVDGKTEFAYLRLGATGIGLGARSGVPWQQGGTASERGQTFELCIYVDDVDRASERLLASGVRQLAPPATRPWGERLTYFADPDGNSIHITMIVQAE